MSDDNASSSNSPGGRLRATLTDHQVRVLLDVVAEAGHLHTVDGRLRAVDRDLADTVRRVMGSPCGQWPVLPSSAKVIEIWDKLWESWADHVAQVGEEHGPYVNHEEHWHPP